MDDDEKFKGDIVSRVSMTFSLGFSQSRYNNAGVEQKKKVKNIQMNRGGTGGNKRRESLSLSFDNRHIELGIAQLHNKAIEQIASQYIRTHAHFPFSKRQMLHFLCSKKKKTIIFL